MSRRILRSLVLASCLSFGVAGFAIAGGQNGNQNGQGQNQGNGFSAPELDPGMGGGAITLVCGILLLLKERRRQN